LKVKGEGKEGGGLERERVNQKTTFDTEQKEGGVRQAKSARGSTPNFSHHFLKNRTLKITGGSRSCVKREK